MSAIAIVFNRNTEPVCPHRFDKFLNALNHYGRDGTYSKIEKNIALGTQHFSSLAKSHESPAPILDRDPKSLYCFCGRIDNRDELLAALKLPRYSDMTDSKIAWLSYLRWGYGCFSRIIGPFIFAVFDLENCRLTIARDALGDQPIYYQLRPDSFAAASEPAPLLSWSGSEPEYDPVKIAGFVGGDWSSISNCYFKGIQELLPGHYAEVGHQNFECRRFWQYTPDSSMSQLPVEEVHERFRDVLELATRAQMRCDGPVAISLSGGLDSTSIATVARIHGSLRAFSWKFDDFAISDERDSIQSVVSHLGLDHQYVASDALYAKFDEAGVPDGLSINGPFTNTVHRLKQNLYQTAAKSGCSVILVGDSADELFLGRNYWLRDLLSNGRFKTALRTLPAALGQLVQREQDGWLVFRLLLGEKFGFRRYLPQPKPDWMTPFCAHQQTNKVLSPLVPTSVAGQPGYEFALGHYRTEYMTYELGAIASSGIERRCPYRDRRVVEFILNLPAWYYYLPSRHKVLVRDAFADMLPDRIIKQDKSGSLSGLLATGLVESRQIIQRSMERSDGWKEFYRSEALLKAIGNFSGLNLNKEVPDGVVWNAVCLSAWLRLIKKERFI